MSGNIDVERVAEIVYPLVESPDVECCVHEGRQALITCSICGAGMCEECLRSRIGEVDVICERCMIDKKRKASFLYAVKSLRLPVIWVLACIVFAGVAYYMGIGNPTVAELTKRDAKWPWYVHRVGKLYLAQGSREKQRAVVLTSQGKNSEARRWFWLAALSFGKAADYWKDTPGRAELIIAQADMLSEARLPSRALELMTPLRREIPEGSQLSMIYDYYCGKFTEKAGLSQESSTYFQNALNIAERGRESVIDQMITRLSGNRKEAEFRMKLAAICGTDMSPNEVIEACRKALRLEEPKDQWETMARESRKAAREWRKRKPVKTDFKIEILDKEDD